MALRSEKGRPSLCVSIYVSDSGFFSAVIFRVHGGAGHLHGSFNTTGSFCRILQPLFSAGCLDLMVDKMRPTMP